MPSAKMKSSLPRAIAFWYLNTRPKSIPQSLWPAVLAVCFAARTEGFSGMLAALAVLGVVCGHLAANLFDDYFDYLERKSDYRDHLKHEGFRARIGKCLYLTSGQTTLAQLRRVALGFTLFTLFLGGVILYFRGLVILWIMGATTLLCLSYSGPPLRLSYRGMGEIAIGVLFGPMNMLGVYYAASGEFSAPLALLSIPVGLLVMNIVYVHSIMDFVPDRKIGKQTLAVLLGSTTAMLAVLFFVVFFPYAVIFYGIWRGDFSPVYGIWLLTLPMAIALFHLMWLYVRHPERRISRRFWMGPMSAWQEVERLGVDWFFIRWFLARNLLSALCLLSMALCFVAP
ncbi:MAG: prenyltransferase [Zoogloeaceae bacterium]|jgi:1,4-dihydroxy-2-naphthoate octaprenyltransferase|nr:prenyltransferase [Zoogloeaceae bacterium]